MNIVMRTPSSYETTQWSGGKTTQFFLAPKQGQFVPGQFDYRVSSATIETDTSDFSDFTGYTRYILPLEGEMRLRQEGKELCLAPFTVHQFLGDVPTKSFGICTDFNFIHKTGLHGALEVLKHEQSHELKVKRVYFIYAVVQCVLQIGDRIIRLEEQNSLIIDHLDTPVQLNIQKADEQVSVLLVSMSK